MAGPKPTQKGLLLRVKKCRGWEVTGEETDPRGVGGFTFLGLIDSFLIYKMRLKAPSMQNWQGDYTSERLRRVLEGFGR